MNRRSFSVFTFVALCISLAQAQNAVVTISWGENKVFLADNTDYRFLTILYWYKEYTLTCSKYGKLQLVSGSYDLVGTDKIFIGDDTFEGSGTFPTTEYVNFIRVAFSVYQKGSGWNVTFRCVPSTTIPTRIKGSTLTICPPF
eukprot:PhF_6_TR267/c0_g1_i1/m.98